MENNNKPVLKASGGSRLMYYANPNDGKEHTLQIKHYPGISFANDTIQNITEIYLTDASYQIPSFRGATRLKKVVLPDTLTRFHANMFEGCSELTSVNIPKSLAFIEKDAFKGCDKLPDIGSPKGVVIADQIAEYSLEGTDVLWHGSDWSHDSLVTNDETVVIGQVVSSNDDLVYNGFVEIQFNGNEQINGYSERRRFNVSLKENDISIADGGVGSVEQLNEIDIGCFMFSYFDGGYTRCWVKLPVTVQCHKPEPETIPTVYDDKIYVLINGPTIMPFFRIAENAYACFCERDPDTNQAIRVELEDGYWTPSIITSVEDINNCVVAPLKCEQLEYIDGNWIDTYYDTTADIGAILSRTTVSGNADDTVVTMTKYYDDDDSYTWSFNLVDKARIESNPSATCWQFVGGGMILFYSGNNTWSMFLDTTANGGNGYPIETYEEFVNADFSTGNYVVLGQLKYEDGYWKVIDSGEVLDQTAGSLTDISVEFPEMEIKCIRCVVG